jgi:hypothetical protein
MLDSEYKLLSSIDEEVEKNHKSVQRSLYDRYVQSFIYSSAPAVISFMLVSNLASILLCLYLLFFSGSVSKPGGFEKGFQTDLGDYQPSITLTCIIEMIWISNNPRASSGCTGSNISQASNVHRRSNLL